MGRRQRLGDSEAHGRVGTTVGNAPITYLCLDLRDQQIDVQHFVCQHDKRSRCST